MRCSIQAALPLLCLVALACEKQATKGELERGECVQMVVRIDDLKNNELGRVNAVEQRAAVDHCMLHGTKRQLECVNFANNAGELQRCEELEK